MPKSAKRKRKKKQRRSSSRDSGPMPSGGAGLIRFFEDETPGIKVGPTLVVILSAMLVVITVVSHIGQQLGFWG